MGKYKRIKGRVFEKLFHLSAKKTNVKTEFLAGLSTFFIYGLRGCCKSGDPFYCGNGSHSCLLGNCVILGYRLFCHRNIWNFPFALAPCMGLNAYFVFSVCGDMGLTWQQGLGCVFLSGMLFVILGMFGVQQRSWTTFQMSLKSLLVRGGFLCSFDPGCKTEALSFPTRTPWSLLEIWVIQEHYWPFLELY